MKTFFSIGLFVLLLALAGCSSLGQVAGVSSEDSLTGKVWSLTQLNGQPLATGSGISAVFTAEGKLAGSGGCNQYNGTYTISGNSITISPLASTMMACEQAVMDQEQAYLTALGQAKTYSVKNDRLTLYGEDKSVLAVYQVASQDLAGTSWEAIGYNNGKQAVTSVIAGTTLTANFSNDGNLTGSGGCNNYTGPYKIDGNKITIGPLASTMKACEQAVMDQETQYLTALQSAATYQIEEKVLELRTADGALAADFNKSK